MPRRYVPKLSRREMERRRLEAGRELLASGGEWGHQARIAEKYGVTTATVARWNGAVRRKGVEGLRARKAAGQSARLTPAQRERLRGWLLEGALAHGYGTDVWTGKRVARLIRDRFGVAYNPDYVPYLLRTQLGFTWQKPERKPRELDPRKVERFLRTWRDVKKTPSRGGARSGSSTSLGPP